MTRDRDPEPDEGPPEEPVGTLRPTSPVLLVTVGLVCLVLGWLLHPLSERLGGTAPRVSWLPVSAAFLTAAILGYVAWSTHRTLHRQGVRLEAHHAVNRLVLAKSCALVGAVLAGGYAGYAVSWLNQDAELAGERLGRSALVAVAGLLIVGASLALERACRVRGGPDRV